MKFNFRGYDYDLSEEQKVEIYQSLMDIESHLTRHFENEDLGNDASNFVSVLISNNTKAYPITLRKWCTEMTEHQQEKFCLGNEKICSLLDHAIDESYEEIYATDDEIKDMFEDYLYKKYYPFYSGQTKTVPTLVFTDEFINANKDLIKAATCNGIIKNHMVKKRENIDRVFSAIDFADTQSQQ